MLTVTIKASLSPRFRQGEKNLSCYTWSKGGGEILPRSLLGRGVSPEPASAEPARGWHRAGRQHSELLEVAWERHEVKDEAEKQAWV